MLAHEGFVIRHANAVALTPEVVKPQLTAHDNLPLLKQTPIANMRILQSALLLFLLLREAASYEKADGSETTELLTYREGDLVELQCLNRTMCVKLRPAP